MLITYATTHGPSWAFTADKDITSFSNVCASRFDVTAKRDFVKTDSSESRTGPVLPRGLRILAIVTGFFMGFTFIGSGWFGLLLGSTLIVGGAVQPWSHRAGKWLLFAGAFGLTPLSVAVIAQSLEHPSSSFFHSDQIVLALFLLVLSILIVWCDVWLVAHTIRPRHASGLQKAEYFPPANYFVWLTAAGASAVFIPLGVHQSILLLHHVVGTGGSDLTLIVLPSLALAVLDVALLIQGVRALHAYLFHRHRTAA
jgi:hypothetical protein